MSVVDADVKTIIDTARDTTPFIADALLVVTEVIPSGILSSARTDMVVKYLAAHLVWNAESNGLVISEMSTAKETYKTFSDKSYGLDTSRYGQMAISMDTTGSLGALAVAAAQQTLPAKFRVVKSPLGYRGPC